MSKITSGITEGWWMFFDTFWALVLGFTLSGIVQAFISQKSMEKSLGKRDASSIAKASFFGVISSSCSYAASALSRSLFIKGADFTTSLIFMFASTNLVIELGVVLLLLLGWQFALAEFIGGTVMILLLAITVPRVIPESLSNEVRRSQLANEGMNSASLMSSAGTFESGILESGTFKSETLDSETLESFDSTSKWKKRKNWANAAGYTMGDFIMLRKELFIGFLIAGLAMSVVPFTFWQSLFISNHGWISAVENALIGPFLAFISFVCSVGNVPLAAALWHAGITFGGVIAFIFADLLAFPLVMIYRKYYGNKIAIRLSFLFWAIMSVSGLITEGIFALLKLIPAQNHGEMTISHFGWNYTTILDAIFALVGLVVFWLYRNREDSEVSEFAQDPICGMQVRKADAPASVKHNGEMYYFCMDGCKESFLQQKLTK